MSDTHHEPVRDLVKSCRERCEEITHFEAYAQGYYALLRSGERLDFMHVENFQPPIQDFDDYYGYMFVQAQFGFFVLRQHIFENKTRPWELYLEIEPHDPAHFFKMAVSHAHELLDLATSAALTPLNDDATASDDVKESSE